MISDFVQKHQPEIVQFFDKAGDKIEHSLPTLNELEARVDKVGDTFKKLKADVWPAVAALGGFKLVLGTIVAMPFIPAAAVIGQLAASFVRLGATMIGADIAVWPVIAIGAGVAGLIVVGKLLYDNWGTIWPEILNMIKPISDEFVLIGQNFKGFYEGCKPGIKWLHDEIVAITSALSDFEASFDHATKIAPRGNHLTTGLPRAVTPGAPGSNNIPAPLLRSRATPQSLAAPGMTPHVINGTHSRHPAPNVTQHVNITVNAAPGMDVHAVARLVASRLAGVQAALAGGALYDG